MNAGDVLRQLGRDLAQPRMFAAAIESAAVVLLIAACAWVGLRVLPATIRRAGRRVPYGSPTLTPVLENAVRFAIGVAALILILQAVHVNVTAIVASAGVASLALGFGAQYLIRDILAGLFILSEGIIQIGDLVRLDGDTGTVERITLRITQIRKHSGELLTVPNGSIARIGNLSRGFGRAVVQVTVPYGQDLARALEVLEAAGRAWAAAHADDVRGQPLVDGAVDSRDAGVVIQLSIQVPPGRQGAVEAALRREVLSALAQRGIRIDTKVSVTI